MKKRLQKISILWVVLLVCGMSQASFAAEDDTLHLEEKQGQLDKEKTPEIKDATPNNETSDSSSVLNDEKAIDGLSGSLEENGTEKQTEKPNNLKVNLLPFAKNASKDKLTFSWQNATAALQSAFMITVYLRNDATEAVYQSNWIASSEQTSVHLPDLGNSLLANELYYWSVSVQYKDGTQAISDRVPFVTAVDTQWEGTDFSWTSESSVANLMRTKVSREENVEKAMLTITALDTEAAKRNVFNVYVNGVEIGVGPTRRNGQSLFYNTYDITDELTLSENIIGLYNYSQAVNSGALMQITYYYPDGTKKVVYNSARDVNQTQIKKMDEIIYGSSNQSIGTAYYTELAQNADTTKYPYQWSEVTDYDNNPWSKASLSAMNAHYRLTPSITDNTLRRFVTPASVIKNGDGSYTVAFAKEIVGDLQLTASAPTKTAIRITLGEQLQNGVAKYRMNTGNVYDETWLFQGTNVTFAGYSQKGFRYATIYNYPGELTTDKVQGIEMSIPYDETKSSFSSDDDLLNSIYAMSKYSYREVHDGLVADSVTRERRAYEGDNLVYQALSYTLSDDYLSARNTWDYLIENPTQYTEYRLMSAVGVYEDYLHTKDTIYVQEKYDKLKNLMNAVIYDPNQNLVYSNGTIDLVDWPRTELPNYDIANTKYKSEVNAVSYKAYFAMSQLAAIIGNPTDAQNYLNQANAIKESMIEKLYNSTKKSFSDGLTATGSLQANCSVQNDYVALAFGIYSGEKMADDLASNIEKAGKQASGSIYMAYFFYKGLYDTGHGAIATQLLEQRNNKEIRSYFSVLNNLDATIAPEAWSVSSKPNMTFSHVWGTGGGIALIKGIFGVEPTDSAFSKYNLTLNTDSVASASMSMPTLKGSIMASFIKSPDSLTIETTVPNGCEATVELPKLFDISTVFVDGQPASSSEKESTKLVIGGGSHTIQVMPSITLSGTSSEGSSLDPVFDQASFGQYAKNDIQTITTNLGTNLSSLGNLETATYSKGKATWSSYVSQGAVALNSDNTPIAAIRYRLTGELANQYDLYYRTFSSRSGWLGWAKNDAPAGFYISNVTITSIQLKLIKKGETFETGDIPPIFEGGKSAPTTLAVRRSNSYYFKYNLLGGEADKVIGYGKPQDTILVGDWDGDGVDTLAVRRGNLYYIKNTIAGGEADKVVGYGRPTDEVLVGDWDGDGVDTLAVRRGNLYYIKNTIAGGEADEVIAYGRPKDIVLVGDWDGDERDTLTVRRGNLYYIKNSIAGGEADKVVGYGRPTDEVLVGDWDGDTQDTLATRRKNIYYIKNSLSGGQADTVLAYGKPNDIVFAGTWVSNN
ncbi:family 78 glycoside hydrolase catalytic domain [Enterococcus sp. 2201sp1_2201st1_C11_2201SCRN_220225]|uniref:family 78 glycoside hydrolase catalytic domain n=1 Tax=Enterococcus sp. 2201sp1_2201st1_C11_2201SCRN_220225 TaxID=3141593 RepID=UPI0034A49B8A